MSEILEIQKNIEFVGKHRPYIYPYRDMEIGDSFFVPNGKLNTINTANHRAGKRLGWKFSARKQDSGIRVWRTA